MLLKSWGDFHGTPSIWPGRGDNRGLHLLEIQRIELTVDPVIFWSHRGEIVDSLSPKVTPARPVVYLVYTIDSYNDRELISVHSTKIGALRVKGRELRMALAERPPELCTQRYVGYEVVQQKWWWSELPEIWIHAVVVDEYRFWPQ